MYGYTVTQWVFLFYVYSFLGWCFESAVVSVRTRKLTNRGFMHGPFLPLYGSGAVLLLLLTIPLRGHYVGMYLVGCVGATALEYVTGVVMEALFKVRYWDYSYRKLQFQGHICLVSTLAWGGLTILLNDVLHKPVEGFMLAIPGQLLSAITFLLTAGIFADFALSFKAAMDLRDILVRMEKARAELEDALLEKKEDITSAILEKRDSIEDAILEKRDSIEDAILEKRDSILESFSEKKADWILNMQYHTLLTKSMERRLREVIRTYPGIRSRNFQEAFETLRKIVTQEHGEEKEKK